MIINKTYKIRIYPNKQQQTLIEKTFGCCRFIYNQMLAERISIYEELKNNKEKLKQYKYKTEKEYKEEFDWLKEVDSQALQQSRLDLTQGAFTNFFKSCINRRKGKKIGYPKFKSKRKDKKSYRTQNTNNNIQIDFKKRKIKLPKLNWINFKDNRIFYANIKNVTVSKTCTKKYFVSILVEIKFEHKGINVNKNTKVIGLDFSMSNFFVDSQGKKINNPKYYRNTEKRLKQLQKRVSKKQLGSKNQYKAQMKVNIVHEKIKNKRMDFIHKLSNQVVKNNDVVVVEDLNMKAMSQCLKFGKTIHDLGWGLFINQLEYKSLWNSKIFLKADKWFASSQICNVCGYQNKDTKNLSVKEWTCPNCKTKHDRDINASKNLEKLGFEILGLGQPDIKPVEFKTSGSLEVSSKNLSLDSETGISRL